LPNSRTPLTLLSPAKINLFLHVTGRRADGYHELETLFQFLDFADTLHFEALDQPCISRIDLHDFALPDEDLSIQAARLLQAAYPQSADLGVTITVNKVIPPGAGLGGGSSNAATTLLALNHLWQLGLTRCKLAELGLQLGADVPIFVRGRSALARGIGEIFEPFDCVEQWFCVCLPTVCVSTEKVFSHPQLRRNHPAIRPGDYESGRTSNDLETVTALIYPGIAEALAQLRHFGNVRMSGSGSALYIGFGSRDQAEHTAAQLPGHLNGFVTRSLNQHPHLDFL